MSALIINVPANCEQYKDDIRRFVDMMLYKLGKNAHKGRWEKFTVDDAFTRIQEELEELNQAMKGGNSVEIQMESADVANFALILSSVVIERGK